MYLVPCFEFMLHRTFFFNAYSGRKSESAVIEECLIQYGFHFFVRRRYSRFSISSLFAIESSLIKETIHDLKYFIIDHIASGFTAPPVYLLQINLALGSFRKGCSFNQSLTYGNEHVKRIGPVPVFAS